jgi:hypothetical protein
VVCEACVPDTPVALGLTCCTAGGRTTPGGRRGGSAAGGRGLSAARTSSGPAILADAYLTDGSTSGPGGPDDGTDNQGDGHDVHDLGGDDMAGMRDQQGGAGGTMQRRAHPRGVQQGGGGSQAAGEQESTDGTDGDDEREEDDAEMSEVPYVRLRGEGESDMEAAEYDGDDDVQNGSHGRDRMQLDVGSPVSVMTPGAHMAPASGGATPPAARSRISLSHTNQPLQPHSPRGGASTGGIQPLQARVALSRGPGSGSATPGTATGPGPSSNASSTSGSTAMLVASSFHQAGSAGGDSGPQGSRARAVPINTNFAIPAALALQSQHSPQQNTHHHHPLAHHAHPLSPLHLSPRGSATSSFLNSAIASAAAGSPTNASFLGSTSGGGAHPFARLSQSRPGPPSPGSPGGLGLAGRKVVEPGMSTCR